MRGVEADLATLQGNHQIAAGSDADIGCPGKLKIDALRVSAGVDFKVVFQASLLAVKVEVNSGIEFAVAHTLKLWNVAYPARGIAAEQVVGSPRVRLYRCDFRLAVCARKLH